MRDLIASGVIETYKLTAVYRQTSGSSIVDNANKIIKGNNNLSIDNTFSVVELNEEESFNDKITQLFDEHPDFNIHNTQVLTTVKRDDGGTFSINNIIHKRFFAGREYFSNFGIGDKIIIGENDYTLGVYNGDMGFVTHILEDGVEVDINGEEKFIPSTSIDLMSLAYAITIHKSQGSEFENVIIALPDNISSMLQRNLLYTAITRAKKRVIILSKNNSFNTAIRQNSIVKRNTALAEKIVQRK